MDWIYLWREMFAQKTRVFLTIFAIAWGTIAICLMLAVGQGLIVTMTKLMDELGSHLVVIKGLTTSESYAGSSAGRQIQLNKQDLANLRLIKGVQLVSPEYNTVVKLSFKSRSHGYQAVSGVGSEYKSLRHIQMAKGRFINQIDNRLASNVVVLGASVVKNLFKPGQDPLGKQIHMGSNLLTVIGVTKDKSQLSQYETPDNYLSWIPAKTYERLFKGDKITFILVHLKEGVRRDELVRELKIALALNHHFNPNDKSALWIFDNENYVSKMTAFLTGVEWFLGIVGALTLLIASIGIANIMFVAVESATSEIGIKLACGALKRDIVKHYLFEALLVTGLGGFIGVVFSYAVILITNPFLEEVKIIVFKGMHLSLPITQLLGVVIVLGVIGFLAGIFPAMRASKIQIVEALRHE